MEKVKNKDYFNQDTELSVLKFLDEKNPIKKEYIFETEIYPILEMLAYKLVHKYRIYSDLDDITITVQDIITHLYENCMPNYNKESGKAFSYFTRSTINFLLAKQNEISKYKKSNYDLEYVDLERDVIAEKYNDERDELYTDYIVDFCDVYEKHLNHIYNEKESKIADAIIQLIRTAEQISIIHKKSLYVLIREITNCETIDITPVVKKFKEHFKSLYSTYEEEHIIDVYEIKEYYSNNEY